MRRWNILLLVILSAGFFPLLVSAQYEQDTVLAKDNSIVPLPTISVNVGFNYGFTDVSLSNGPSPVRQLGYQLTISQRVAKFLDLGFELYSGTIYGEDQRDLVNINYRTSLVSPRVNIEYNFFPLLKPDRNGRQLVRPYIGFGLGALFFRSKGDLKDSNGNVYNYWSNGNIYAEAEGTVDVSEATQLTRDFEYETDLRDANLDGFRKYSQMAFTMPLQAGVRFQITKNFGVNAAFSYVFNFTDLIDNVNLESVGIRQGSSDFDNHLFGSIGISVFLGTTKPSSKPIPRFEKDVSDDQLPSDNPKTYSLETPTDFSSQNNLNDSDSESDESLMEPLSELQNSISDNTSTSKSNEPMTIVNTPIIKENSSENVKETHTIDSDQQVDHQSSQGDTDQAVDRIPDSPTISNLSLESLSESSPKETGDFHWADLNKNNWISPDEVLYFIDLLFEGDAEYDVVDVQNLIDYYFDQD